MLVRDRPDNAICNIDSVQLENVTSFQHLGRIVIKDGDETKAVDKFISERWHAYRKVKSVMSNRKTPMITKKKSFETYILPCVMYASETITLNKILMKKFEVFQNNIMRICVNKRKLGRISIENLINMTKLTPITTVIKQRKLSWFGNIKRSNLPIRTIYEEMSPAKRKKGRPKIRWRDDVKEGTNLDWNRINDIVRVIYQWRNLRNNTVY